MYLYVRVLAVVKRCVRSSIGLLLSHKYWEIIIRHFAFFFKLTYCIVILHSQRGMGMLCGLFTLGLLHEYGSIHAQGEGEGKEAERPKV